MSIAVEETQPVSPRKPSTGVYPQPGQIERVALGEAAGLLAEASARIAELEAQAKKYRALCDLVADTAPVWKIEEYKGGPVGFAAVPTQTWHAILNANAECNTAEQGESHE